MLITVSSCFTQRDISSQNMVSQYRKDDRMFQPSFSVFHPDDSLLRLFIRISPESMLFVRQTDDRYRSTLKVSLQLVLSYESNAVLDSISCVYFFDMQEKSKQRILVCDLPHRQKGELLLQVALKDASKNFQEFYYITINNYTENAAQCFMLRDSSGMPLFRNYLLGDEKIKIQHRNPDVQEVWCKYYNRNFPLPAPPFSFDVKDPFNYHSDSIFLVNLYNPPSNAFEKNGFYHFQLDTTGKTGLTLFRFGEGFPVVNTPSKMLETIRYLTSRREFEELQSRPNTKLAVESFWLEKGGNPEKTRNLIRKYYNRVQDANRYFSSYTEGWKTDRGMLYIIMGSPNTILRSSGSESWIYGTANSSLALNFLFTRVDNPFTDNDFIMSRAPIYESNWYRAVETWRQGRAYNSMY